jgi:DNA-binding transcriptional MerR regulator
MDLRVEELARRARVSVDTVRFYQSRGLLPGPRRQGRVALYSDAHLERLGRIRSLRQEGFTLAQIQRLLAGSDDEAPSLLEALTRESVGERTLDRATLAAEAGVPEPLVQAAQGAGLIEAVNEGGEERFGESEIEMLRAGLALLEAGFPMQELLGHAVGHAEHVQTLCDAAIDLFDDHVRKAGGQAADDEAVTALFQKLLPQVTRLVALHFQRTLVNRALNRLRGKDEHGALEAALAATESGRLEVEVNWR